MSGRRALVAKLVVPPLSTAQALDRSGLVWFSTTMTEVFHKTCGKSLRDFRTKCLRLMSSLEVKRPGYNIQAPTPAVYFLRFARRARYARASFWSLRRSLPSKIAFLTILQAARGLK